MKHFVITKNGIARIMHASDDVQDPMDEIAKWPDADQAQVTSARQISSDEIPSEKRLRDAWVDTGTEIRVDLAKARQCTKKVLAAGKLVVDEGAISTADLAGLQEMLPK